MLWREGYRPRVLTAQPLPEGAPASIFVGAFDPRAQSELGIWLRLFADAGLDDVPILLIRPAWAPGERRRAESAFAPSLHRRFQWVEDAHGEWNRLIQPDRPERSFAAIVEGASVRLLVIGPPTEEVWERFEEEAKSLLPPAAG